MNFKKPFLFLILVSVYALILVHNLVPHCHHQHSCQEQKESEHTKKHHHHKHSDWWNFLLNHHPEGMHGDDDIVKFLRVSDTDFTQNQVFTNPDSDFSTILAAPVSIERLLAYNTIKTRGKQVYLLVPEDPVHTGFCRLPSGRAPPMIMNI